MAVVSEPDSTVVSRESAPFQLRTVDTVHSASEEEPDLPSETDSFVPPADQWDETDFEYDLCIRMITENMQYRK